MKEIYQTHKPIFKINSYEVDQVFDGEEGLKSINSKLYGTIRGVCLANLSYLRDFFNLHKVEVHLESGATEIGDDFIKIKDKEGKIAEGKVDLGITTIGYKEALAFENNGNVHIIGDAYHVGNLRTII